MNFNALEVWLFSIKMRLPDQLNEDRF